MNSKTKALGASQSKVRTSPEGKSSSFKNQIRPAELDSQLMQESPWSESYVPEFTQYPHL